MTHDIRLSRRLTPPRLPREERPTVRPASPVVAAVERRLDSCGLAFAPDVVRDLGEDGKQLLLAAARDGLVELRPESGLGRLSDLEIAACPKMTDGTPLSWVRPLYPRSLLRGAK
jgi:hypothetical protein